MKPRSSYNHPGPLGPAFDLDRLTGWDFHHTAVTTSHDVLDDIHNIAEDTYEKFGRSSYNYVNHPEDPDETYEMQGLHIGAHNDGENSTRVGYCFFGYYHSPVNDTLSGAQIEEAATVVAHGFLKWGIPMHGKGHKDSDATACPGDHVYKHIHTIIERAKEIVMSNNHDHDLEGPMPEWGEDYWDRFVRDRITTVEDSWRWAATRLDLAWIYSKTIVPLRNRVSTLASSISNLQNRVDRLERNRSSEGGVSEARVKELIRKARLDV